MNKALLLLLFAMPLSFCSIIYTVDTDRSGYSSVTLSIDGGQEASVPLPADAAGFRIVGGSYSLQNGSAEVVPGQSGFATFSFTSASLTAKTGSGWRMSFSPPEGSVVMVYMPSYSVLEDSSPQPDSVTAEDSRAVLRLERPGAVSIYYHLEDAPVPVQGGYDLPLYLLAGAVLVLAAVSAYSALRSRRPVQAGKSEIKPTLELTAGKKGMMETFNENDLVIVHHLLSNGGKSRRNELERRSGLSKSSLAMALNRLEKRRIVEIDRGSTTHFIRLSEYFLRL